MKQSFCPEKNKPGGCQLPSIHCGYPECDKPPKSVIVEAQTVPYKRKKPSRKKVMSVISDIQGLIGTAKAAYQNDRDPDRAQKVVDALEKAFNLAVRIRD